MRNGKVRCGQCRAVFDALESLLDDSESGATLPPKVAQGDPQAVRSIAASLRQASVPASDATDDGTSLGQSAATPPVASAASGDAATVDAGPAAGGDGAHAPTEAQGVAAGGRWLAEKPAKTSLLGRRSDRLLAAAGVLLVLLLVAQSIFFWRGAIAVAFPGLRPALATLSEALGSELPLPRDAQLIGIEASDLQTDPGRGKLLILQATLRNRAAHEQAYPALELSLTDTNDRVVVRRVLLPDEYLSPSAREEKSFAANASLDLRLWLEAKEIDAAGYRLYVFYP